MSDVTKLLTAMERGVFPITPKYRVEGKPGSHAEMAVEFTGGMRSYFDVDVVNIYDDDVAQKRYQEFLRSFPNHDLAPYAHLGLAVAKAETDKLDDGFQTLQQFAAIAREEENEDWVKLATLQSGNIFYNQKKLENIKKN